MSSTVEYKCDGCGVTFKQVFMSTVSSSYIAGPVAIDACETCTMRMRRALHDVDSSAEIANRAALEDALKLSQQRANDAERQLAATHEDLDRALTRADRAEIAARAVGAAADARVAKLEAEAKVNEDDRVDLVRQVAALHGLEAENEGIMDESNALRAREASALNEAQRYRSRNSELMVENGELIDVIARLLTIARRAKHSINEEEWLDNHVEALALGASSEDPVAARVAVRPRRQADVTRQYIQYTKCGQGGCPWPAGHVGVHAGACGCVDGCKAADCPNG